MVLLNGLDITPAQYARYMVYHYGEGAYFHQELNDEESIARMTEKEEDDICKRIAKQLARTRKFLNIDAIPDVNNY